MRLAITLVAAATALSLPATANAQPSRAAPPSVAAAADQLQALGAWVKQITDALAPANEGSVAFARVVQDFSSSANESEARAKIPGLREANVRLSGALSRSEALLAQVRPLENPPPTVPVAAVNRILTDARAQLAALRQQAADTEALAAAFGRRDNAAVRSIAPKLARAGFLHLKGAAATYRARQAMVPADRSVHQMASVTIALYDAMSASAESWFAARIERRADAATLQNARFKQLADDLEREVRIGRRNLARERTAFASAKGWMGTDSGAGAIFASAESMSQLVTEAFAIGDEIAGLLRAGAGSSAESLATRDQPLLLAELSAIEQRYVQHMARAAGAVAQSGK